MATPPAILCIASYEKGHDFLRQCKESGARVFLLTSLSLQHKAAWPVEAIDNIFYMPDDNHVWNRDHTLYAVAHLCRDNVIDLIVPLDDFDLEMAAFLRAHLRIGGMGESTTRHFRDKLAMRIQAEEVGLSIPDFVPILNHQRVNEFLHRVPPPWVLKPRLLAGAIGIQKVHTRERAWELIHALGDQQSFHLLERFVAGDICHVDSIVYENELMFAVASEYGRPPLDVSHSGDIFTASLCLRGSEREKLLLAKNSRVLAGLGLLRGVSHTEFIIAHEDGKVYFLETSARVGGAHIADLIEAATGVNMWREWAKVELAGGKTAYQAPPARNDYAGLLVSLAKQQWPDLSAYDDPEIVWRMQREHHAGLIVRSPVHARVVELMQRYKDRFRQDFWAVLPPQSKPTH
ncbi:MAG: ATPase [Acidobacteria bacterium]|nr:ATPase [Acidobacteriota bacterium]